MIRFCAVLSALSLMVHAATAVDFEIVWDAARYGGIVAAPGDTVTFTYGANSDLWIHPTGDCTETGRIQLGPIGPGSATYNFTDSDIGTPITFASSVGNNCENGQIITFTVAAATQSPSAAPTGAPSSKPTIAPTVETTSPSATPTKVPTTPFPTMAPTAYPTVVGATNFDLIWFVAAYGDVEALVGDSVTFTYDEFSDVWIHPSGDCTQDESIFVGQIGPATVTYRFTQEDAGKSLTFTSSVSDNCLRGQIITFNVVGPPTAPTLVPLTPSPTIAPQTVAPIFAPVRPFPTLPPVPTVPPTMAPVAPPTMSPVAPTPTTSAPVGGTPTTSAPVAPTTSAPIGGTPTTSAPVGGTPTTSAPAGGSPTTSAPVGGTPTTSAPVGGTPTTSAPVGGTPTTSAPVDTPTSTGTPVDSPTNPPVEPTPTTARATDLSQTLLGMTSCDTTCQDAWIAQMFETTEEYFFTSNPDVTLITNTPKITSVDVPKRLRRLQSGESGVTITYDHTFEYISESGQELEANDLATQALADESSRTQFLADLKSRGSSFVDLTGVTAVDASLPDIPATSPPTKAPTSPSPTPGVTEDKTSVESILSNTYVLIGIGVGVLLLLFMILMCCRKGRNKPETTEKPSPKAAASPKSNGERSVASAPEEPPAPTTREELIHIFAPPGKLGVVIDTPSDGASFVHAVKPTSIIADRIKVGDKLVAVDDEDVRSLSAINVSKLIGKKSSQPTRKLTVLRTIPAEP